MRISFPQQIPRQESLVALLGAKVSKGLAIASGQPAHDISMVSDGTESKENSASIHDGDEILHV